MTCRGITFIFRNVNLVWQLTLYVIEVDTFVFLVSWSLWRKVEYMGMFSNWAKVNGCTTLSEWPKMNESDMLSLRPGQSCRQPGTWKVCLCLFPEEGWCAKWLHLFILLDQMSQYHRQAYIHSRAEDVLGEIIHVVCTTLVSLSVMCDVHGTFRGMVFSFLSAVVVWNVSCWCLG